MKLQMVITSPAFFSSYSKLAVDDTDAVVTGRTYSQIRTAKKTIPLNPPEVSP